MTLTANAFGKVMIAGEYSVLFGGKSIVTTIDRAAIAIFKEGPNLACFSQIPNGFKEVKDPPLWLAARKVMRNHGLLLKTGEYYLDTRSFFLPNGLKIGLGSSAALSVALVRLILLQNAITDEQLMHRLAFEVHQEFSTIGSGADIAASCNDRPLFYYRDGERFRFSYANLAKLADKLIFIYTGKQQNTRDFLTEIYSNKDRHSNYIEEFRAKSDKLVDSLLKDPSLVIESLGLLLGQFGKKFDIDIMSLEHQTIADIAKKNGGSAKPSGAGGGDIALAFLPTNKQADFISNIQSSGFRVIDLKIRY